MVNDPHAIPWTRRQLLQGLALGLGGTALIPLRPALAATPSPAAIHRLVFPFGRSLRVAQLSDLHIGSEREQDALHGYVDLVNREQPDLVVLTGDFLARSMLGFSECAAALGRLTASYGRYAVWGNHDHWFGRVADMRPVLARAGVHVLTNQHVLLQTPSGPFVLAGADDLLERACDLRATLWDCPADLPVLLLSHEPEVFPQAAGAGVRLTLAGHWHGGQINLLPVGHLTPAAFRTPYIEGWYQHGTSRLYVNRGIGTSILPIRLNAPPEVTIFDLV